MMDRSTLTLALSLTVIAANIAFAQYGGSLFGPQILKNSTETIPAHKQYRLDIEVLASARHIIDVQSRSGDVDVFLMSAEQWEAGKHGAMAFMRNEEGKAVQIVESLTPGIYHVIVQNVSVVPQEVGIRIFVGKE